MNIDKFKELIDSCFIAKKITETMEELPKGFKPRHIHVIDSIYQLSKKKSDVRISDVSSKLNVTTPSITKLINELEEKFVVEKYTISDDKRVILVKLTELGMKYHKYYVTDYHTLWAGNLDYISDEDVDKVVYIINRLKDTMPKMK